MVSVDNVGILSEDPNRRRTIPIFGEDYNWWTLAVGRQLVAKGMNQKDLAVAIGEQEPAVSRCIRRTKPVYEILIAISDYLAIAYPVVLPTSEEEALHVARERRLFRREVQAGKIKPGVAEIPEKSQSETVPSEHAIRSGKAKTRRKSQPRPRA